VRGRVLLVYVLVSAVWGSTWAVNRLALFDVPPLRFVAVRMALAALLLAPAALRGGAWRVLARDAPVLVGLVGLFQVALPYGLMFVAQQWVPSSLAAVLFATFPIWIALLAWVLVPGERLTPRKLFSAVLGIAGVAVLQAPHLDGLEGHRLLVVGSALMIAASIVAALANVLVRRHLPSVSPLAMTAGQSAVGALALGAASLLLEAGLPGTFTPRAMVALLYLAAFGTGLTYVGLYWLIPRVPLAAIGAIPLLDTTVAVFLGAALLGEPLGWHLAAGGAMVLAAAALAGSDRG
jgi:drug/metabolite transporter (DMT)-like permease